MRFWVCFAVRALRSLGLGGLGRAAPGDERIGLAVLSPPRVILSQARISRGKGGWGVLASIALPCGARCAAGVRIRRCLPLRGKSASELARRILAGSRERVFCGAFCPSGNFPGAPGKRSCGAHLIAFAFRGEYSGRGIRSRPVFPPLPPFRARKRPSSRPPRRASFPRPSRGETCGLCPHPLKGPNP